MGACVGGLYAESGVTFILGEPNKDQENIIKAMKKVNDVAVENLKEGNVCEEVNKAASEVYREYNLTNYVRHRSKCLRWNRW